MHLAKKYLLSFGFILSLGVLQLNMIPLIKPVLADASLLNQQKLLKESTAGNYGSQPKDVKVVALSLLKTVLTFLAILTLILVIMAGFKYMLSGGNEAETKEAIGQIKALVIGLVIILASWGFVKYLLKWLVCSTTAQTGCTSLW